MGLRWRQKPDGGYALTRLSAGRVVVLNFDPMALSGERLVCPPLLIGLARRSWSRRWARVSTPDGRHPVARIDAASAQVPPLERRGEALDLPADAGA
jgi:hypothetical protein